MSHLKILQAQNWLICPREIAILAAKMTATDIKVERAGPDFDFEDFYDCREPLGIENGIAEIAIKGPLVHRCAQIYEDLGLVTRYSTIQKEIEMVLEMNVKGIIFKVNSPGGSVVGCQETAEIIAACPIPTCAEVNGYACSAAYWLASQCGIIVATVSSVVGNIGAITSWQDWTKYFDDVGVKDKALVSEGASLKSTFHLEPSPEQVAFLQDQINYAGEAFRNSVKSGRANAGVEIQEEVWKAGWYSGQNSLNLGLVDSIGKSSDVIIS